MSRFAAAALALLAAGCATVAPPAMRDWPSRRAELQALADWSLDGRIALAAAGEGFSGGLDWRQSGERAEIVLRRPMGGAAFLIHVEGADYVVTDAHGTTYDGEDARRVLERGLGPDVPLPVAEMRYWLVGTPAPGAPYLEALGDDQRLASLDQSGWRVIYDRYGVVGTLALPRRIEMTAGDTRLRVVVADWRFGN